jgi:hypothetical protein
MVEDLLQGYSKTFSTCPGQNLRLTLAFSTIGNFTERISVEPCLSETLFLLLKAGYLDLGQRQYFLVDSKLCFKICSAKDYPTF